MYVSKCYLKLDMESSGGSETEPGAEGAAQAVADLAGSVGAPLTGADCDCDGGVVQEALYQPIRVLGRGAFGEAVLYRRAEDNSLVVWKEVDLSRLGEKEKRDAQNEIEILSLLNHTNIISYFNHFLDGDVLLIEMEYANGGSLSQKISRQKEAFAQEEILWWFYQLMSAVANIHEYGILHRDIKSLNIFLTKAGLVKLGDFGISKILDTKSEMAQSYVGTPYYMSPELIKGESYNYKSDIWAAGCVLYELLTLNKVFDATNPLRLATEIVQCDFADISPTYSKDLRALVGDMLNKNATFRPSAEEILNSPVLDKKKSEMEAKVWQLNAATRRCKESTSSAPEVLPIVTSKSSEVYFWGGGKLTPQKLEVFSKGRSAVQVSAGHAHFAAVTVEKELYTWADIQGGGEMVGQLGHGDKASYRTPKRVDALEGVPVKQVSCGEDFTVCVTDEGAVYAFGSDYYGCMGCDNAAGNEVLSPLLVDFFTNKPVVAVSCGYTHVVALTSESEVYTWGCGEYGQLGLGSEDDHATPQKVQTRGKHSIKSVHAGLDGTFLVKTNGRVLACGSNEHNKLGFNSAAQGLRKSQAQVSYDIPCKYVFSTVKPLSKYHVVHVAPGRTHTAVVDLYGHLITFGSNKHGQLGVGDFRPRRGVNLIQGPLTGHQVQRLSCGDGFTIAADSENQVYSWGCTDNGRLGMTPGEKGKGQTGQGSALPRPIFGSLHAVSDVSSQNWHTILVAEKVLSQKTIRSTKSAKNVTYDAQLSEENVFAFRDDLDNDLEGGLGRQVTADSGVDSVHTLGESSVPPWLQAELEDEFIPNDPAVANRSNGTADENQQIHSLSQEALPPHNGVMTNPDDHNFDSTDSSGAATSHLSHQQLEEETRLLQQQICKKDQTIEEQNKKIRHLEIQLEQLQEALLKQSVLIERLSEQVSGRAGGAT